MKLDEVQLIIAEAIADKWMLTDLRIGKEIYVRFDKRDCRFEAFRVGRGRYKVSFFVPSGWMFDIPDVDTWRFQTKSV